MKKSLLAVIFITTGLFGVDQNNYPEQNAIDGLEESNKIDFIRGIPGFFASGYDVVGVDEFGKTSPDVLNIHDRSGTIVCKFMGAFNYEAGNSDNSYMILVEFCWDGKRELRHYLVDCINKKKIMILREEKEHDSDYDFILGKIFLVLKNTKNNTTKILRIAQLLKNAVPI